jgi:UPF0755 protein
MSETPQHTEPHEQLPTRPDAAPPTPRPRRGRGSRLVGRFLGVALVIVVLALVVLICAYWRLFLMPAADVEAGMPVVIEVSEGADSSQIAESLADSGVVPNANMFRRRASELGLDAVLQPGVYELETGMDYETVISRLAEGPPPTYVTVTIPEGWTIEQMAERYEAQAGIPADEFSSLASEGASEFGHSFLESNPTPTLEGYLFPKTYEVEDDMGAREVIEMMLDQFAIETAAIDTSGIAARGLTIHEWVTIASIVEREVRVPEERPLVASVVYNRLAAGMRLEIDATIEYVLPGTRPRLSNEDLQVDSAYNTYRYGGLPPGPIASPGKAALEAAAAPADTDFVYYVRTGEDGSHTFTNDYTEFLEAKERSREVIP